MALGWHGVAQSTQITIRCCSVVAILGAVPKVSDTLGMASGFPRDIWMALGCSKE